MQKIKKQIVVIIFLLIISISNISYGTQEEILESQAQNLNIKGFVSEANKYTEDVFSDVDINDLMNDAIKGKINNKTLIGSVLSLFGSQIGDTIKIIRKHNCCYCSA